MPTYEFGCLKCGERFEIFSSISQKEKGLQPQCPKCGSPQVAQIFGKINFLKSGGGSADAAFRQASGCGCNPKSGCCG